MSVWAPISSEAQRITPRLTDRLSESIKSLKICFVLVFRQMVQNGTSTFHYLSSHITTVIKRASKCHLLKHSMDDLATHH
jgi:hypothetical protein